jgi:L-lactate dehydrogenase (cytochrome)
MDPCSVEGYRQRARRVLPAAIFDYLDGGAETEGTLRRNRGAYGEYGLVSPIREEERSVDPSCVLLGASLTMPVVLAPTGGLKAFWPDGERAVARAAAASGVLMAVSAGASTPLAEVAAATAGPKWFQICVYKDWELLRTLLSQAAEAGYTGLCVTLDGGLIGKRERDVAHGLELTWGFALRNLPNLARHWRWSMRALRAWPVDFPNFPRRQGRGESLAVYFSSLMQPSPTWRDLERIRKEWSGHLILKAIATPADALRAVKEGIDAIVVSNHGGRQFDSGCSTLELLAPIARAVDRRIPVLIDGGISRGTDVLKAIALGASACMIGRAHLWGLAVDGERGARAVLNILGSEIRNAMHFCGAARLADLGGHCIIAHSRETS